VAAGESIKSALVGEAHNYGPTPEDIAEQKRIEAAAEEQKQAEAAAAAAAAAAAEAIENQQKQKELEAIHAELEKEEDEILKLRSLPLRKYLIDCVIPTLTQGLINTCKIRPVRAPRFPSCHFCAPGRH
jgi:adenylate kinase